MKRLTMHLNFDEVLNAYQNWACNVYMYSPLDNLIQFSTCLNNNYKIIVFTSRNIFHFKAWLIKFNPWKDIQNVTNIKGTAFGYISERNIKFSGSYKELPNKLTTFTQ